MATFIQAEPSMAGTTKPTDAGTLVRGSQWGIDATLSGFIIQDVSISEERITDTTQDQKGAVVSQLDYDAHWTMSMNVIGGDGSETGAVGSIVPGDTSFSWAGSSWKVTSVTFQGNYADKKKYTIAAERWTNFPAST